MNTPLSWSVRRELWENRALVFAPPAVASVVLFGFLVSAFTLPRRMRGYEALTPGRQRELIDMPFSVVAGLVMMTAFVVAFFYCLDALQSERRDRSILFWKSLPVSDRTAVLSKAAIPLIVLPAFVFAIVIAAQLVMLAFSTLVLLGDFKSLGLLWTHVKFIQSTIAFLYALIIIALWHAPLYGWLLLISAWARRAAVLWAILPPLLLAAFVQIAFGSKFMFLALGNRMTGWFKYGFAFPPKGTAVALDPFEFLTPGRFLARPGLWIGLLFAWLFLAGAVRLRRDRGPI